MCMDTIECIYSRRSIRKFKPDPVSSETINQLLEISTMAPSSSNTQPWSFVVIQDIDLLKNYSDSSKEIYLKILGDNPDPRGYKTKLSNPDFNVFYNAGTVIIIYGDSSYKNVIGDCSLAAQNLMLAAHHLGLGTCWIGFAEPLFNSLDFKEKMGIPQTYKAVAPIILGYPAVTPKNYSRKEPNILFWK